MRVTGAVATPQRIPDRRQYGPYEQGPRASFFLLSGAPARGAAGVVLELAVTSAGIVEPRGAAVVLPLALRLTTNSTISPVTSPTGEPLLNPTVSLQVAFQNTPLTEAPTWTEIGSRGRSLATQRGRSYEFDRMETGTLTSALDNRDAALTPGNTSSPYAPLISTRPFRALLIWDTTYPLFRGITEGYPQQYPSLGADAVVEQHVNDLFYALNNARFTPGQTFLLEGITTAPTETTSEQIAVGSTVMGTNGHPLPQVVPFGITIEDEALTVTEIVDQFHYQVTRGSPATTHTVSEGVGGTATPVTTTVVSFAEELSGSRIERVLEAVGFDANWFDLDTGQTLIADSTDLSSTSPLEHINLVVEAEFGRFFVSKAGKFTFKDRSSVILDYLDPVLTFSDGTLGQATDVPYVIEGALEHSEDKLFNRIKITTPSGFVADISDTDSIADHFERVFEREWPYANDNDATSAAHFILMRSVEHSLRLPALSTAPARNPSVLWPLLLVREIGERCRFYYQPDAGDAIDQEVIIEGIEHQIRPGEHRVRFQLTEADPNEYWILGLATYGELGTATVVAF